MGFAHMPSASDYVPVLQRIVQALAMTQDQANEVDIITFAESPEYLGLTLYPRQKLILKLYHKLSLEVLPCWCTHKGKQPADPECRYCRGTGRYDEFADVKYLLRADDKYARLYFPGLCRHHITGDCTRKICKERPKDYQVLTDDQIRARLLDHHAHILEIIAGRRGTKSVLGVIENAYQQHCLLRLADAARWWGLIPGQLIGTANVATDETQALGLFNQLKAVLANSPWFQKLPRHKDLETYIEWAGRGIYSRSFHSNSASVRGNTLLCLNLDEFCHMNKTTGKQSDTAMWEAIRPSIVTFGEHARVVITSSPLNKAGKAYELFARAEDGTADFIIAFQFAAWEMNPTISRWEQDIAASYQLDPDSAEMEYGGQWAEQVGVFIPYEAIEGAVDGALRRRTHGEKGVNYAIHIDMAKKHDSVGIVICHYDEDQGSVLWDRIEEFAPDDPSHGMLNEHGEIDLNAIFQYVVDLNKVYKFHFNSITCDQFESTWLIQEWRRHFGDIKGEWIYVLPFSAKLNQQIYANLRSLLVQGGLRLYKHSEMLRQLTTLSKTIRASGAWTVEAPPGCKDDLPDAGAAATWQCINLALGRKNGLVIAGKPHSAPADDKLSKLRHHRDCRPHACSWECPVQRARKRELQRQART